MIMTDRDNNQITAFHPGAMSQAHANPVPARSDIRFGIIAPDGRDAMLLHAEQLHAAGVPFVFDPGQGLPMFNGDELEPFVELATWVTVNDYEGRMLCDRTGLSLAALSEHVEGLVVTLADQGCEVWERASEPMCRVWRPPTWSTPPAVAMRFAPLCCTVWRRAGIWCVVLRWATAWALPRSPAGADRTTSFKRVA